MKEHFPYRYRSVPSENLYQISWKSNKKLRSYREERPMYKCNFNGVFGRGDS